MLTRVDEVDSMQLLCEW